MKLANPNQSMPYEHIYKDSSGQELYGERTVDGEQEIVDMRTGKSNMTYLKPEKFTFYENCVHIFKIVSVTKREVECIHCWLMTHFHPAINYVENSDGIFIRLKENLYPIRV